MRIRKSSFWLISCGLLLLVVSLFYISIGEYSISINQVIKSIMTPGSSTPDINMVIRILRLPRLLSSLFVGCALGVSGAILQSISLNPLASPGILGINSGAGLAAVGITILGASHSFLVMLPLFSFLGALISVSVIYLLTNHFHDSSFKMILIGIAISSITSAGITLCLTFGEIQNAQQALTWLSGSVYGRKWLHVYILAIPIIILFIMTLLLAHEADVLSLGNDIAMSVGSSTKLFRSILLIIAIGLASVAVSICGPIGFIGLASPHISRKMVGIKHFSLLMMSGLTGALLVVISDLLGKIIFSPIEMPVGVITAFIGAPYFIILLTKKRQYNVNS
ncbi:FecCD family ABC transporter permease [Spirochaeta cellobiosiphila]|uniref:FecCD family ABC transporter permease n=1 Tax=Spirochaeta cellobiosiphila TaxID=504483 RepID=UPI00040279F6|nr:iron ABC transporter permease [Spirochaeta cellobiosiphila]